MNQNKQDNLILLINKKETVQLFKDRISKANIILENNLTNSTKILPKLKDELESWDHYNVFLLERVFSDKKISDDYQKQRITLGPSRKYWLDEIQEYRDDLNGKIKYFLNMIEISELLEDDSKNNTVNKNIDNIKETNNKYNRHSPEFMWTIFSVSIGAAFALGLYLGQAKFDKEKSDYYEDTKNLRNQNKNLKKTLIEKNSLIKFKQSEIIKKTDSLEIQKKNINNLYLILGGYFNKKKQ